MGDAGYPEKEFATLDDLKEACVRVASKIYPLGQSEKPISVLGQIQKDALLDDIKSNLGGYTTHDKALARIAIVLSGSKPSDAAKAQVRPPAESSAL